ncbi:MAG: hypothetical protein KIT14_07150 [bacterium]|nr:hypothetical protein [bacterium]
MSFLAALLVVGSPATASAASECRRSCAASKRTCLRGAKGIFRSAKSQCALGTDRKPCVRRARTELQSFKQGCGTALRACRSCCAAGTGPAAAACAGPGTPVDTSSLCPEARGGLAAYWDWLNGVFHPLAQIPTAGLGWTPFQHTGYPLLGFLYPPGWSPFQLAAEQSVGVELYRGDGAAVWRFYGTWGDVSRGVRSLRDAEVGGALQYLGNPGPVRTVCVNEAQATLAPGIFAAGSNIAVEAGAFTVITIARTTMMDGLAGGQVIWNTIVVPTAELDRLVFDVFLPIHFQLFVGRSTQDSDLDGVPDSIDAAPGDPTRS